MTTKTVTTTEKDLSINGLEYWTLKPYTSVEDRERPYVQLLHKSFVKMKEKGEYSQEFSDALDDIEVWFGQNRTQYSSLERRHIESAIKKLKGSQALRLATKAGSQVMNHALMPVMNHALKPVVNKAVLPAVVAVQGFFTGLFKKSDEQVRVEDKK
jgi:alpha-L-arabinofuranosidase